MNMWVEHDTTSVVGASVPGGIVSVSTLFSGEQISLPVADLDDLITELSALRDRLGKSQ